VRGDVEEALRAQMPVAGPVAGVEAAGVDRQISVSFVSRFERRVSDAAARALPSPRGCCRGMRRVAVAARRAAVAWQWRPTRFAWIESQDGGALMIARVLEGEIDAVRIEPRRRCRRRARLDELERKANGLYAKF
jgi:hypothetical protein